MCKYSQQELPIARLPVIHEYPIAPIHDIIHQHLFSAVEISYIIFIPLLSNITNSEK
jgi:hypothetical protein